MAYILRRETEYNDSERQHIVATLVGSGYTHCETDSPKKVFTKESSTITLSKRGLQLSFSSDEGSDREHLQLLLDLKGITKISRVLVDNKIDLRHLSATGLEVSLEQ